MSSSTSPTCTKHAQDAPARGPGHPGQSPQGGITSLAFLHPSKILPSSDSPPVERGGCSPQVRAEKSALRSRLVEKDAGWKHWSSSTSPTSSPLSRTQPASQRREQLHAKLLEPSLLWKGGEGQSGTSRPGAGADTSAPQAEWGKEQVVTPNCGRGGKGLRERRGIKGWRDKSIHGREAGGGYNARGCHRTGSAVCPAGGRLLPLWCGCGWRSDPWKAETHEKGRGCSSGTGSPSSDEAGVFLAHGMQWAPVDLRSSPVKLDLGPQTY